MLCLVTVCFEKPAKKKSEEMDSNQVSSCVSHHQFQVSPFSELQPEEELALSAVMGGCTWEGGSS